MRIARHWIWTRAKHPDGLERPHFCARFRGQSDVWVAPAVNEISLVGMPACLSKFCTKHVKEEVRKVKTVRITHGTFVFTTFFTRSAARGFYSQRFATTVPVKVAAQCGANRAGATPLFCGRAAQKFREVAPALAGTSRRRFARPHGASLKFCQTKCLTSCMNTKGEASCRF